MTVDWKPIAIGVGSALAGAAITFGTLFAIGITDINKIAHNSVRNFIYLEVSDVYAQAGTPVNVSAMVIESDLPASSAPVTFYSNGNISGSDITNKYGKASMIFTFPLSGRYILYAQSGNMTSNLVTVVVY